MTSRIAKFLREAAGVALLSEADALRSQPLTLNVAARTPISMARTAVALALRCFNDAVYADPTSQEQGDAMLAEAHEYGAAERLKFGPNQAALALGLACRKGDEPFVDARGWQAAINQLLDGRPPSAAAAAFATAAGVAKLFCILTGRSPAIVGESWRMSLLTFGVDDIEFETAEIDIGHILLIGAGAIGSGFAHVIRTSDWRGSLEIVDRERYDEPNHETTMLISKQDARDRAPKASTLARLIDGATISARGTNAEIDANHVLLRRPWSAVLSAVDNPELRRCLDTCNAPLILNAGVGGTRLDAGHVLWSRHGLEDQLLSSLYPANSAEFVIADAPADITDECSRLQYANTALAAPFLGLTGGALLAAGLAQSALRKHVLSNYFKLDLLGRQSRFEVRDRRRAA